MIDETEEDTPREKDPKKNPNIEWKNKGFDPQELMTRKVNRKEALEHDAKKKSNLRSNDGKKVSPQEMVAPGLQKIKTKIKKDAYDEEEEDERFQIVGSANDNSLLEALNPEEKKQLKQKTAEDNNRNLQNAERLGALNVANLLAKEAGAAGINQQASSTRMGDATYNKNTMKKALNKDLAKQTKVKQPGKLPGSKNPDLINGMKRIKEKGGRVGGMNVNEVTKAAKASDKGVAEIIYKTSNTADKKKIHEKVEVKYLIEKTGRGKEEKKEEKKQTKKTMEKQSVNEIQHGNVKLQEKSKVREQNER